MVQSITKNNNGAPPPYSLVAELTHRCPLHCPYCSNPLEMISKAMEISNGEWCRVLSEAADLGVVEVHFSGGEPLLRGDLEVLIRHANSLEMYTNLITSGIGLTTELSGSVTTGWQRLVEVGLGCGSRRSEPVGQPAGSSPGNQISV
jgi:pyrroloquinoline quinone biosynthesis protein E